ncbi:hypothetical protein [Vibrio vulnificus YJ016]|uniref:Uncharacterized protein n=1 Tax=Vibrio vulnificus (strain YJ016) TaxID=196600 RepID=Q7ML90_VIBVY|nr:hypothetical protein [Vibrio vulnificus YJ016]
MPRPLSNVYHSNVASWIALCRSSNANLPRVKKRLGQKAEAFLFLHLILLIETLC